MAATLRYNEMQTPPRVRAAAALGSAATIALVGWLLVFGLNVPMPTGADTALALLDIKAPPPPPRKEVKKVEQPKRSPARNAPSPRNLKAKPTEVVTRPPIVVPPPVPPPIVSAPIAGHGTAPSAGASNLPGPGYGAGGEGNGFGGGGDGDGGGIPPRPVRDKLANSDVPANLLQPGVTKVVSVRYYVNVDGSVTGCRVTRSSGTPELDSRTCSLIEQRFRYKPARDEDGQKVRSILESDQYWSVERDPDEPSTERR